MKLSGQVSRCISCLCSGAAFKLRLLLLEFAWTMWEVFLCLLPCLPDPYSPTWLTKLELGPALLQQTCPGSLVSGDPDHLHPLISAHLALLLWALLSWDGTALLFLLFPASLLEIEAVVDFYRIIFLRWMLANILQVHSGHTFMFWQRGQRFQS